VKYASDIQCTPSAFKNHFLHAADKQPTMMMDKSRSSSSDEIHNSLLDEAHEKSAHVSRGHRSFARTMSRWTSQICASRPSLISDRTATKPFTSKQDNELGGKRQQQHV
jgi:hypothetical protein